MLKDNNYKPIIPCAVKTVPQNKCKMKISFEKPEKFQPRLEQGISHIRWAWWKWGPSKVGGLRSHGRERQQTFLKRVLLGQDPCPLPEFSVMPLCSSVFKVSEGSQVQLSQTSFVVCCLVKPHQTRTGASKKNMQSPEWFTGSSVS